MKPVLASNEAVTSTDVGAAHVENFALKIFDSADEAERAGQYSMWVYHDAVTVADSPAASPSGSLLQHSLWKFSGPLIQATSPTR
jgi:hypothetical protein